MHQVGAGVLGPVFRAYDPDADRTVAVKSFPLVLTPEQADEFAARLDHLTRLPLSHPSIVAPLASGVEGSTAYLVEEYFVAESVDVALRQYGPAPVADALRLIGQLAGAIDFAAVAGVHHGLLHARDILVAPHEVRLTGLGIAAALESVGFKTAPRRPYSAPERVAGGSWGIEADIYSLAVVGIELLTGRRAAIPVDGGVPDLQGIPAADRAALSEAFARALAEPPQDRFPTALAFASALKHALVGAPLDDSSEAARPRKGKSGRGSGRHELPVLPLAEEQPSEGSAKPGEADDLADALPGYLEPTQAAEPESSVSGLSETPAESPGPVPVPSETSDAGGSEPPPPDSASFEPGTEKVDVQPPSHLGSSHRRAGRKPERRETPPRDPAVFGRPVPEPLPEPRPSAPLEAQPRELDLGSLDFRPDETEPATEPEVRPQPQTPVPPEEPLISNSNEPEGSRPRSTPVPARRAGLPLSQVAVLVLIGMLVGVAVGYFFAARRAAPQTVAQSVDSALKGQELRSPAAPVTGTPIEEPQVKPESPTPATPSPGLGSRDAGTGGVPPRPTEETRQPAPVAPTPSTAAKPPAARTSPETARRETRPRSQAAAPPTRPRTTAGGGAVTERPQARARFEGSLVIVSRPPGASVRIDGHPVGTTPMTMSALSAGSHVVRLEREGYRTWSAAIQIVAGRQNRVSASLDRQ